MSFFNQLKNKAEELNKKHGIIPSFGQNNQQPGHAPGQQQQQQQQQYGNYYADAPPPPIPYHSRPGGPGAGGSGGGIPSSGAPGAPQVYWRPDFHPAAPVSRSFEHKLGHGSPHGWGNNELQNYTDSPSNSFHTNSATGQQLLILRAVAQPSHPDPESRYTSARLVSRASLGRASGFLSAALTLPCASGIWPAFWLLPREPFSWPRDGEVDIAESWNGDCANHSCLHWGFYNGAPGEPEKHRVRETRIPDMGARGVRFDFAWLGADGRTRLVWYIDGRPVMREWMPAGARPIADFCVLLNVAMGGNVCRGKVPNEGAYDLVVHDLHMSEAPPEGGWGRFEADWQRCQDGAVM